MLPAAFIEHQLPHRLRLKIPSMRGDGAFFEELARRLSMLPGVTALSANPVTASILIHHAGDSKAVTSMMVQEGLLDVRPKPELSVRAGQRAARHGCRPVSSNGGWPLWPQRLSSPPRRVDRQRIREPLERPPGSHASG